MKRRRAGPPNHYEGDTNVEDLYEPDEDEGEDEASEKESRQEEQAGEGRRGGNIVGGSSVGGSSSTRGSQRKGPTTRSHGCLNQIIEKDWIPSSDEESNPGDLCEDDNDGAQFPSFRQPDGRISRARKQNTRIWYDENSENPEEKIVKNICFLVVQQFKRALLTFYISQNRNYSFHRNCSDRVIVVCSTEDCPVFIVASQTTHERTFSIKKMNLYHNCVAVGESTKVTARFHGLFMCLNACKEGFLNGYIPFIGKLITG
ncbi:hypothetical protein D1007_40631 [Hordeum vulgare]|nr:hypothetical protein D1007_40631 [Hordeum vulgare]